jgi:phosphatidate cytidylyltransferase
MIPLIAVPVLLGAAWLMAAVLLLSLLCFREFARSIGFFREYAMSSMVVGGILAVAFSVVDNWYGLFVALTPFTITIMAAVAILRDHPQGYIQRLALAVVSFVLFGVCLGHLGYMGNDPHYRPIVLLLLLCVQINDLFAFVIDKAFGGPRLVPRTSARKTIAGGIGGLLVTTALFVYLSGPIFSGETLDGIGHRIILGLTIGLTGQFGELAIASVRRDVGLEDPVSFLPGRGGFLDRANSLLFSAPALLHYANYFHGIQLEREGQVISRLLFP